MEILIILQRFALTFALSLIFGLERQRSHKPISFGTFIFVAMGSCGLGITAIMLNIDNPLPLLSAIVTGIGFLGAGALIKTTDKIFGFTTAAAIWLFAILGLVIGVGNYFIGILIYASVWVVIFIDKYFEVKGIGSYQKRITITANRNISNEELKLALGAKKHKVVSIEVNKKGNHVVIVTLAEGSKEDINKLPHILSKKDWVSSFKIE